MYFLRWFINQKGIRDVERAEGWTRAQNQNSPCGNKAVFNPIQSFDFIKEPNIQRFRRYWNFIKIKVVINIKERFLKKVYFLS